MVDILIDDIIKVDRLDPDGKKYDKVSRIEARSEEYGMEMQLDVHTEIYPVHVGEKYRMALAPSLNLDGTAVTSYFPESYRDITDTESEDGDVKAPPRDTNEKWNKLLYYGGSKSLADKFEYVMHGLLYKMSEDASGSNAKVVVYMSFGGLQLMLKGDPVIMSKFKLDQRLFLLMRKM